MGLEMPEVKAPDDEQDGECDESHQLDGLAAYGVDERHGAPVAGDGTSADEDSRTGSKVEQDMVNSGTTTVSDRTKHSSSVQVKTVEGDVEHEPRTSRAEQDLAVSPLAVVAEEIAETGLGDGELVGLLESLSAGNLVGVSFRLALHVSLDIVVGFLDIAGNIESVSRRFWDGETVVESDASGNSTET